MVLCSGFFGFKVLNIGIFVCSESTKLKSNFICDYFDGVQVHHFSTLSMHSVHLCIPPTMCVILPTIFRSFVEIMDLNVAKSMKWTYLMFMQIWSMKYNQLHGYFVDTRNSYIYAMDWMVRRTSSCSL
jgi:hypothetical protein